MNNYVPEFGDLVFILKSNTDLVDWSIDARQGFRRANIKGRRVTPVHVAIATGSNNNIFHAVRDGGVCFSNIFWYIYKEGKINENILVYRNNDLKAALGGNFNAITEALNFFRGNFGAKYNTSVVFGGKRKPDAKFCSELAADFMLHYGVLKTNKRAEKILPLHLLNICISSSNWMNVPTTYTENFDRDAIIKHYDTLMAGIHDAENRQTMESLKASAIGIAASKVKSEISLSKFDNTRYSISKLLNNQLRGLLGKYF